MNDARAEAKQSISEWLASSIDLALDRTLINQMLNNQVPHDPTSKWVTMQGRSTAVVLDEWGQDGLPVDPTQGLVLTRVGKKRFVARYEGTRKVEKTFIGAYPKALKEFTLYKVTLKLVGKRESMQDSVILRKGKHNGKHY